MSRLFFVLNLVFTGLAFFPLRMSELKGWAVHLPLFIRVLYLFFKSSSCLVIYFCICLPVFTLFIYLLLYFEYVLFPKRWGYRGERGRCFPFFLWFTCLSRTWRGYRQGQREMRRRVYFFRVFHVMLTYSPTLRLLPSTGCARSALLCSALLYSDTICSAVLCTPRPCVCSG